MKKNGRKFTKVLHEQTNGKKILSDVLVSKSRLFLRNFSDISLKA